MTTVRFGALLACLLAVAACSDPKRGDDGGGDDQGSNGSNGSNGSDTNDGCSDQAKLIYVVDQGNELLTFDPVSKQFSPVGSGALACTSGAQPFSMGVDRNANAWVLYDDGELFQVDTSTLACTPTSWSSPSGLFEFGMGFSTNDVGGDTDTLFIAGGDGPDLEPTATLATVDTGSLAASTKGTVSGWPELTGNANAELWGWFPDPDSPKVAQLDKSNGSAIKTFPLPQLAGDATAWAFAFFGGDYYVFLAKDLESTTTVYQIDGSNGSIKSTLPTSHLIVGAGVSTCAPVILQ